MGLNYDHASIYKYMMMEMMNLTQKFSSGTYLVVG